MIRVRKFRPRRGRRTVGSEGANWTGWTAISAEAQLRAITDALPSMVAFVDTSETYRYANAAFLTVLGIHPDNVIGKTMRAFLGEAQYPASNPYIRGALEGQAQHYERSITALYGTIHVDVRYIPHCSRGSRIDGFHVVVTDITARVEQVRALERAAAIDTLTGALNRGAITRAVSEALEQGRHRHPIGVCYIDIDHFKLINDTFGHATGDEVLRVVAQRLRRTITDSDILGRVGGDEFVVLFGHPCNNEVTSKTARDLCAALASPILFRGRRIVTSISVGIAIAGYERRHSVEELLHAADRALYDVKRSGRGTFKIIAA